jgi:hypothetical protein
MTGRSTLAIALCRAGQIRQISPLVKDLGNDNPPGLVLMMETPLSWTFSATQVGL